MFKTAALTLLFGKPMVMYGGIFTFLLLLTTATIGFLNSKGKAIKLMKWHPRLSALTIIFAIIHAIFGLSILFNF